MAYQSLMSFEAFANAKNYAEARKAVEAWKVQYSYDDITREPYLPSETFSNFALELVSLYKGKTQKYMQNVFNEIYDLVQGKKQASLEDLMDGVEVDDTPRSLGEAIKEVLDLE